MPTAPRRASAASAVRPPTPTAPTALPGAASRAQVYCGGVHDLLNERAQCRVLEDAQGEVQVRELTELVPDSLSHLLEVS